MIVIYVETSAGHIGNYVANFATPVMRGSVRLYEIRIKTQPNRAPPAFVLKSARLSSFYDPGPLIWVRPFPGIFVRIGARLTDVPFRRKKVKRPCKPTFGTSSL
jgi:hypothetical protein